MRTAMSTRAWLAELGLVQHAEIFDREQIDMDAVRHLTDDNLKDLGLPMGHRAKVLAAIRALAKTPDQSSDEPPAAHLDADPLRHLAKKILTPRSAMDAERRQITVMFCEEAQGSTRVWPAYLCPLSSSPAASG